MTSTVAGSMQLDTSIDSAVDWLAGQQQAAGFWVGTLESNACMEAEWLLAMHFMGIHDWPDRERVAAGIARRQRNDGSWEVYHDAPMGDVNVTVEAYVALRAAGMSVDSACLSAARAWLLHGDRLRTLRVFTRYWLALIGEWPWSQTPNLPPEAIFFPRWFPFNIYNFASWARATMIPLAVLSSLRPVRPLPCGPLDELFPDGREHFDYSHPRRAGLLSWDSVFLAADAALNVYQTMGLNPGRKAARKACLEWIIKHQDPDGAWGGIQPPWVYSLMALHAEGYRHQHPVMERGLSALDGHWSYERGGAKFIQASESPVWDTVLAVLSLLDAGVTLKGSAMLRKAVDWLLEKQVREPGDWQVKVQGVAPGGWSFERANTWYPDIDDTAVAMTLLARVRDTHPQPQRIDEALQRARNWIEAMQCANGGWAAFDRDNDKLLLTRIPFCDFGEALDPPSVDVTAHVVEALGLSGISAGEPCVTRALEYILSEQEEEGSWFGRWGVNHIYGTGAVLPALRAIGQDMRAPFVLRAAKWLESHQNADGGWGESCASYMDDSQRGRGPSTASQTGWALMALVSLNNRQFHDTIARGVSFLLQTQRQGTWDEPHYTGTGFPGYGVGGRNGLRGPNLARQLQQGTELARGFMINYNLYRHYFPLMALGRARVLLAN